MSKQQNISSSQNQQQNQSTQSLQQMSTEQLRALLKQLQNEHDLIEVKNEELATHISDMRTVIKKVQKEKDQELNYIVNKKKKLTDQIDRCEAALKVAHSKENTMFADMVAFKQFSQKD